VLLVRHGRTSANAGGVLAGWTPGVALDERGTKQAEALAESLKDVPLSRLVTSPLQRCYETADIIAAQNAFNPLIEPDERLAECRYGSWTGKKLKKLFRDPLWRVVQETPSAVHFPGKEAESLLNVSRRANEAVRYWVSITKPTRKSPSPVVLLVSHGDVIKAILADALGMHLDMFQRIVVDPCSVSMIRYAHTRPLVLATNAVNVDFSFLKSKKPHSSHAQVGGGRGVRS
jgi:probable phosphomutase (TIGR03848 family)